MGEVKETYPVVLIGGDVVVEVLLKHAIDSFSLPVGLRIEGSGKVELYPQ